MSKSKANGAEPETKITDESATAPAEGKSTDIPDCPYHKGHQLKSNRSEPFFTRYYCPVDGCQYSLKVARPNMQKLVQDRLRRDEDHSAR